MECAQENGKKMAEGLFWLQRTNGVIDIAHWFEGSRLSRGIYEMIPDLLQTQFLKRHPVPPRGPDDTPTGGNPVAVAA